MSFGFSVGDITAVCSLAWKTYSAIKTGPEDFQALEADVHSLTISLEALNDPDTNYSVLKYSEGSKARELRLSELLRNSHAVLKFLTDLLDKYGKRGEKEQREVRDWFHGYRFAQKKVSIAEFRNRLAMHIAFLNIFLQSITHFSLGKLERLLTKEEQDLGARRAGAGVKDPLAVNALGLVTTPTVSEDGLDGTWSALGLSLRRGGRSKDDIAKDVAALKDDIVTYVNFLLDGGMALSQKELDIRRKNVPRPPSYSRYLLSEDRILKEEQNKKKKRSREEAEIDLDRYSKTATRRSRSHHPATRDADGDDDEEEEEEQSLMSIIDQMVMFNRPESNLEEGEEEHEYDAGRLHPSSSARPQSQSQSHSPSPSPPPPISPSSHASEKKPRIITISPDNPSNSSSSKPKEPTYAQIAFSNAQQLPLSSTSPSAGVHSTPQTNHRPKPGKSTTRAPVTIPSSSSFTSSTSSSQKDPSQHIPLQTRTPYQPSSKPPSTTPKISKIICDAPRCPQPDLPLGTRYYHCSTCQAGGYDVCEGCYWAVAKGSRGGSGSGSTRGEGVVGGGEGGRCPGRNGGRCGSMEERTAR